MNTYIKGICSKKTVFNWWIGDGYSRNSCLTGKSGVILLVAFPEDTGSPLILPSTSTPCPNPPGIQITWGQHERNITNVEIPLWVKSFGQFYKRLSMNMVCTCLPPFLPKKRDYLFPTGETESGHPPLIPTISYYMTWFPPSFWPGFRVSQQGWRCRIRVSVFRHFIHRAFNHQFMWSHSNTVWGRRIN